MAEVLDVLLGLPVTPGAEDGLEGSVPPVMRWADFTTLLRAMRLWAVLLPYRTA